MPCCQCCCGGVECQNGQQVVGKCCCGGGSGECCADGQYCCNGVCKNGQCCGQNSDCPPASPYCCGGGCSQAPCCPPAPWPPPAPSLFYTSGCVSDFNNGIVAAVPPGHYRVNIRVYYAAYNRQGPGCTSFKFRTSVTGQQVYEVNGCGAGPSTQSGLEFALVGICKPPADETVTVEIFDYFRGWVGQNFEFSPPYSQCLAFDAPGWGVEVLAGPCDCENPLP